jgi:hypothetical protein
VLESFRSGEVGAIVDEGSWDHGNREIITELVEKAKLEVEVWKEFSYSAWSAHHHRCFRMGLNSHRPISFGS